MSFLAGSSMDRRTFVKSLSAAGLGLAVAGTPALAQSSSSRRRFAIVGTGSRSRMYTHAIEVGYKEHAELVGVCDVNPGRMELIRKRSAANGAKVPPAYLAKDFDSMIRETKPDTIIVTTVDATHAEYIVRALDAGCDVITEKPMTTTAEMCQDILDARKRSGRQVIVAFNYRYTPPRTQVKELLMNGAIGDVLSVDFQWMLNTHHGADYFRRWHAHKKHSGGLMIHKSTHHFDLVNWWLSASPVSVFASGKREFYTPQTARRLGLKSHHERCHTCPEKDKCSFFLDLAADASLKALYLDQEHHDGYFRDRCVWRPEIDIEDTMNVIVNYDTGATLSYSLNAFNAWEGYQIVFNGTQGRIEHSIVEQTYVSGADMVQGGTARNGVTTRVFPLRGAPTLVEPWKGEGGHGGGDKVMLDALFLPTPPEDKYLRTSDERGGAYSILVGVAANKCFETGQPVKVADLVTGLTSPALPPMPTRDHPLQMPPRDRPGRG
ncbi:MAG TPA: Gfo/Idh/MocA family oxidoreductase [Candidatus Synoicihabitans sp.]|nr:Gfo/Idh/MocA family oxidoreductase [Candidatus Synoicihabitans sp.]